MNADVEKAVEYCREIFDGCDNGEWALIEQALRGQEAEIAELRAKVVRYITQASDYSVRISELASRAMSAERCAKKAETLLREALPNLYDNARNNISARITAHLGAEQ